jgi:hypothetical protein
VCEGCDEDPTDIKVEILASALPTHTAERTSNTTPSDSRFMDVTSLSFVEAAMVLAVDYQMG